MSRFDGGCSPEEPASGASQDFSRKLLARCRQASDSFCMGLNEANPQESLVSNDILAQFINEDLLFDRSIFSLLLGHLETSLNELRRPGHDAKALGLFAHKAKSGCRSFGAIGLGAQLERLEAAALTDGLPAAARLLQNATALIDPTLEEIKKRSEQLFEQAIKKCVKTS